MLDEKDFAENLWMALVDVVASTRKEEHPKVKSLVMVGRDDVAKAVHAVVVDILLEVKRDG